MVSWTDWRSGRVTTLMRARATGEERRIEQAIHQIHSGLVARLCFFLNRSGITQRLDGFWAGKLPPPDKSCRLLPSCRGNQEVSAADASIHPLSIHPRFRPEKFCIFR